MRPNLGLLLILGASCGSISEPSVNTSPFSATFYGYSSAWQDATATLTATVPSDAFALTGPHSATEFAPHTFGEVQVRVGNHVMAKVTLRDLSGNTIAQVETTFEVLANWQHGLGFQVGGRNPDLRGFCHRRTVKQVIPGPSQDTLYLWNSSMMIGPVC